jgi:uncharacterized RDD family membrane protein YckC
MGQDKDKEDWNFDVDTPAESNKVKDENRDAKRKKRGISKEPLYTPQNKKLGVTEGKAQRKISRSALAKKEGGRAIGSRDVLLPGSIIQRGIGFAIDWVILALLTGGASFLIDDIIPYVGQILKDYYLYDTISGFGADETVVTLLLVLGVLHFLFMVFPLVRWKTTIGKNLAGVKVIGIEKESFGFGKALFRETIFKAISFGLVLGFIWPLFNKQRRSLHDLLAGTLVPKSNQ